LSLAWQEELFIKCSLLAFLTPATVKQLHEYHVQIGKAASFEPEMSPARTA